MAPKTAYSVRPIMTIATAASSLTERVAVHL